MLLLLTSLLCSSVCLTEQSAQFRGLVRETEIAFAEVEQATWRAVPAKLELMVARRKHVIEFGIYRVSDQPLLVQWFRDRINPQRQHGWETFNERLCRTLSGATPDEQRKVTHMFFRAALAGPIAGMGGGLFLYWYAFSRGVTGAATWSGSELVDGLGYGVIASASMFTLLAAYRWALTH